MYVVSAYAFRLAIRFGRGVADLFYSFADSSRIPFKITAVFDICRSLHNLSNKEYSSAVILIWIVVVFFKVSGFLGLPVLKSSPQFRLFVYTLNYNIVDTKSQ